MVHYHNDYNNNYISDPQILPTIIVMAPKYLTRSIRILLGSYIGSLASSFPDRILFYPGSVKDPEQDPVPVQEPNRIMDRILFLCRISYRTLQYPKGSYKILQDRTRSYKILQEPTRSYNIHMILQYLTGPYRILQYPTGCCPGFLPGISSN